MKNEKSLQTLAPEGLAGFSILKVKKEMKPKTKNDRKTTEKRVYAVVLKK